MGSIKAREGQWYLDRVSHDKFCVIAIDDSDGLIDIRDRYGDVDEFDLQEWEAMDLEPCSAPPEWQRSQRKTGPTQGEHQGAPNAGSRHPRGER